ncbi:MAG: selenium cofactor biosynthesis protein YqeC, partial [Desulfuromusa sp.]
LKLCISSLLVKNKFLFDFKAHRLIYLFIVDRTVILLSSLYFVMKTPFLNAFNLKKGDTVSICGAGGKTTLLYRLANEAKARGYSVLITTTTKLFMPEASQYDAIDLSGNVLFEPSPQLPGVYFCATGKRDDLKVTGVSIEALQLRKGLFDLILIEADGAAQKRLKGWRETEPVIPEMTTKTIGIVDIQTLNQTISEDLVYRVELFCQLVGSKPGAMLTSDHLLKMIRHKNGLFQHAHGQLLLLINKVESQQQLAQARALAKNLPMTTIFGSLHQGVTHAAT